MKKSRSLKVRQDTSQRRKTVEVKQLPLKQEDSNFKCHTLENKQNGTPWICSCVGRIEWGAWVHLSELRLVMPWYFVLPSNAF